MDLKCNATYHSGLCSLYEGDTTEGLDLPEEVKAQMLADFPELFTVLGGKATAATKVVTDEVEVTNQEEKMVTTTPEDKMPKTRKKA